MRSGSFALAVLAGTMFAMAADAAPLASRADLGASALPLVRVADRAGAVAAGAVVGGALGVIVGSQIGRAAAPPPVVYAAPPPPEEATSEVVEEELAEPAPLRRRASRRVVEVEEDEGAPVEPRDCVTRRTKTYDPATGRTVFTKERDCR
jgi:hypothetical protein